MTYEDSSARMGRNSLNVSQSGPPPLEGKKSCGILGLILYQRLVLSLLSGHRCFNPTGDGRIRCQGGRDRDTGARFHFSVFPFCSRAGFPGEAMTSFSAQRSARNEFFRTSGAREIARRIVPVSAVPCVWETHGFSQRLQAAAPLACGRCEIFSTCLTLVSFHFKIERSSWCIAYRIGETPCRVYLVWPCCFWPEDCSSAERPCGSRNYTLRRSQNPNRPRLQRWTASSSMPSCIAVPKRALSLTPSTVVI